MIYLLLTWLFSPLVLLRRVLEHHVPVPQNILLIQTAKIGDYICTTPLIHALRDHFPSAHLSLLVSPLTEPLARHQPGVDSVFTLPGGQVRGFAGRVALYRLLRREHVDTTICISPNQAFLLIPFLAGVTRRASILPNFGGRSYRAASAFLTAMETHRQGRMMAETGIALLRQLGVTHDLPLKEIGAAAGAEHRVHALVSKQPDKVLIGIGLSSGNKLKELGPDRLREIVQNLLDYRESIHLVLIGTEADAPAAKALCDRFGNQRISDTSGRLALEDIPVLLDQLDAFLGVDSGLTYLADARSIPVVDIMGPADPEDQRPTGKNAIVIRSSAACAPCSHAFSAPYHCHVGSRICITGQSMDAVVQSVLGAIRANNPNAGL